MTEATMIAAHQAGLAYWRNNRPLDATKEGLASLARSCGWHGEDNDAWLAGFYGAKRRDQCHRLEPCVVCGRSAAQAAEIDHACCRAAGA